MRQGSHQPQPALLEQEEAAAADVHTESGGRIMEESWLPNVGTWSQAVGLVTIAATAAAIALLGETISVSTMTEPARTATMLIWEASMPLRKRDVRPSTNSSFRFWVKSSTDQPERRNANFCLTTEDWFDALWQAEASGVHWGQVRLRL